MKDRSSSRKAKWSETREQDYLEACNQILFERKAELFIDEPNVYLKTDCTKDFLLTIAKPKTMWYEIWYRLKDI